MASSTNDLPRNPEVKVIFKGFVVTRVNHNATSALIGAHPESDCHRPMVEVFTISPAGQATKLIDLAINEDFSLVVENPSELRIEKFQKDDNAFNRLDPENDPQDFRWFVDLNQIHGREQGNPVTVLEEQLQPKLRMDKGVFHAHKLSDDVVRIKKKIETTSRLLGRYATEVAARIDLSAAEIAIFKKGADEIFRTTASGQRYEIVFDCACRSDDPEASDFDLVYDLISGVELSDQLDILPDIKLIQQADGRTLRIRRNPEVYCTGGNG